MKVTAYRADIQGMRALAVLAVIAFHCDASLLPGGFVGVDVFFVISGYLAVQILQRSKESTKGGLFVYLRYFYAGRIRRVIPAYYAMLLMASFVALIVLIPSDLSTYRESLVAASFFNSNAFFSSYGDYFAVSTFEQALLHTWSLSVEVKFYLVIPFAIYFLKKRQLVLGLSFAAVLTTLLTEYKMWELGAQQELYYSFFGRIPAFCLGCLAATSGDAPLKERHKRFALVGLGMILVAFCLQNVFSTFPGISAWLPSFGAMLILKYKSHGVVKRILTGGPLVFVGEISYSLYLWHWPILAFLRYSSGGSELDSFSATIFVVLTVACSAISYYIVEQYFRRGEFTIRKTVLNGLVVALVVLMAAFVEKASHFLTEATVPLEQMRYADPEKICHGRIVGECLKGDLQSESEILVLGDSHAAMLNVFFDEVGRSFGVKFRVISASSCVPIIGFDFRRIEEWGQAACLRQIEAAGKYLANARMVVLAGMWSRHLESPSFRDALMDFAARGSSVGKILVMAQVPMLKQHPLRTQRQQNLGFFREIEIDNKYKLANAELEGILVNQERVYFLSFQDLGVFREAPYYQRKLIYFDTHHLNEFGAKVYAQQAKVIMKKWLLDD